MRHRSVVGVFGFAAVAFAPALPASAAPQESESDAVALPYLGDERALTADGVLGFQVAMVGDTVLVAGFEPGELAYVFERQGDRWVEARALGDPSARQPAAAAVALSSDTAVVGTYGDDAHLVYVFSRDGDGWGEAQVLGPSDPAASDSFGGTLALSGDTLVVGADTQDENRGAAYVFVRDGATWREQQRLVVDTEADSYFGEAIAIDGDTALVAAPGSGRGRGAAYVFARTGSTWSLRQQLSGATASRFGYPLALAGDTALVGAEGEVLVYGRHGSTWSLDQEIAIGAFVTSIALDGDAALLGAGAHNPDEPSGAAYLYVRDDGRWHRAQTLTPSNGAFQYFGVTVALSDGAALVASLANVAYVYSETSAPSAGCSLAGDPGPAGSAGGLLCLASVLLVLRRRSRRSRG
jgi:hypothetical protein